MNFRRTTLPVALFAIAFAGGVAAPAAAAEAEPVPLSAGAVAFSCTAVGGTQFAEIDAYWQRYSENGVNVAIRSYRIVDGPDNSETITSIVDGHTATNTGIIADGAWHGAWTENWTSVSPSADGAWVTMKVDFDESVSIGGPRARCEDSKWISMPPVSD